MSCEKILVLDSLDENSLNKLFSGEALAIHIKKYADKEISNKLTNYFIQHPKLECHPHDLKKEDKTVLVDYGVDRVGVSYNTTFGQAKESENYKKYFEGALPAIREVRNTCAPYLAPFDKFRLELDEMWSPGASIANFEGRKMHAGIARVMKRPELSYSVEKQPHFDGLQQKEVKLIGQYSVNIYIYMPEIGGELELWDVPAIPIENLIEDSSECDWRGILPISTIIRPEQGDLIMFNTRKPHAIRSFSASYRVTLQSFIGVLPNKHLMLWN
ncbi:2OG-Fe(II) oxygenase [Fluviispira multicolorata]|uniref:2OG-Fe(II) oxygenase n=1 Tax=Fluviispira multicolorata TaxID=2654512 RepID=A0A833JFV7_9BACT|nr:2OG-Fe(II) oxygenase [Fluviispira multicolorata]KAB8031857.1 2OG-Fe(II) oxygenase [Fluviispira multicolorata]